MANTGALAGRLALVTGAGSGIGRAVARVFARDGASIAVVDRDEKNANETLGSLPKGNHAMFTVDVSSSESVNRLLSDIQSKFSSIPSIAVNSAGITQDRLLHKMKEEEYDKVLNVNLKGTFLVNQIFSKAMVESKVENGSIINISSIAGKIGNQGQANYAASKAGVMGLTKTVAKELGRYNIRANCILPGFIQTPMTDVVPEHIKDGALFLIPLGRMGQPDEIAEVCAFLASEKSSYITGATIEVSGGFFM